MNHIPRSFLFVPGDRPDRFAKAAATDAHQIVIDLEDAVAPAGKQEARKAAAQWLADNGSTAVRINGADTEWFNDDLAMLAAFESVTVMLAKAELESLNKTAAALVGRPIIALVETVKGYMELRQIGAVNGLLRIAFGSIDFGVESGIADEDNAMTAVRTQIVLESVYAGLQPPVDGVSVNFGDEELIQRDALRSKQLGFGGKLCIHPKQIGPVNGAYRPTAEQVDWAHRVLTAAQQSDGGATTIDGKMVDKPVVIQAERIVADANRGD